MSDRDIPATAAPLRVLYIHHAGVFGGASRSLMEMIAAFPRDSVVAYAIVPRGAVGGLLRQAGAEVLETTGISQFDCTRYGYYRGLRWLIVLREAFYVPFTLAALLMARNRWPDVELVHINDTTQVVCIALAGRLFRAPVIVHARALLASDAIPRRARWLGCVLARNAQAVVAIDENVRATLPAGIDVEVIHNGFAPGTQPRAARPFALADLSPDTLKVAMVGSLSPMKGVYEFVQAASIVAAKGMAVDFILVGEDIRPLKGVFGWLVRALRFGRPVRDDLQRLVTERGMQDRVHFLGFVADIKAVYDAIDVVCFPSHLDAPGRPVFEAAFSGVPAIVALRDPRPDTMVDGETGICISTRDPAAIAAAIERLYHDRDALKRMGQRARAMALRNFDVRHNAGAMLALYRRLLARAPARRP